tara:strand:+ start:285 stop:1670 length:1386 start_codon:yes stop_codon:yes gene_type:complete
MDKESKLQAISEFVNDSEKLINFNPLFPSEVDIHNSKSTQLPELEYSPEVEDYLPNDGMKISEDKTSDIFKSIDDINQKINKLDKLTTSNVVNNFVENKNKQDIKHVQPDRYFVTNTEYSPLHNTEEVSKSVNLFVNSTYSVPEKEQLVKSESETLQPSSNSIVNNSEVTYLPPNLISNSMVENYQITKSDPDSVMHSQVNTAIQNMLESDNTKSRNLDKKYYVSNDLKITNTTDNSNEEATKIFKTFENKNNKSFNRIETEGDSTFNRIEQINSNDIYRDFEEFKNFTSNNSETTKDNNKTFITNISGRKVPVSSYGDNVDYSEYNFMQEGGYVDSPTPTIVGENSSNPNRKSPEIITPLDKVPKILAEANTIEKANMNASQTAFNITNENQTVKQEDATNQSQAMVNNSNPVLPVVTPPTTPSESSNQTGGGGGSAGSTRINEILRETHSIPKWRQMLG